jgi:hypothetical protein
MPRRTTQFGRHVSEFLATLRVQMNWFLPETSGYDPYPGELHISRALGYAILAGEGSLTDRALSLFRDRLQKFLDDEIAKQTDGGQELRGKLRGIDFVAVDADKLIVDRAELLRLFHSEEVFQLTLKIRGDIEKGKVRRLVDRARQYAREGQPVRIEEGCTEITVRVTRASAERIEAAFARGELVEAGVIAIRMTRVADDTSLTGQLEDSDELFEKSWRRALRKARFARPWRRLRWVVSTKIAFSPLAHIFQESETRSYASAGILKRWSSLKVDLEAAFLLWPMLTGGALIGTLFLVRLVEPSTAVGFGVISGVILSIIGAQACAAVVSPLGVGAGGIALGYAFGLAHALAVGRVGMSGPLSTENIQQNPFTAVTGGIVGLAAPQWLGEHLVGQSVVVLGMIAASIVLAGWLMGQGRRARGQESYGLWRDLAGTLCGAMAGAGIGAVYGLTVLLQSLGASGRPAFVVSFTLVGGLTFALTVWLRTRNLLKALCFAVVHSGITCLLCQSSLGDSGGAFTRLVALSAATAWYHSTWFTAAFVLGGTVGSVRAATLAAALEGAGGFIAFAVVRMLWS